MLTTGVVIVVPAVLAGLAVPAGTPLLAVGAVALAIAISLATAKAGAAVWQRCPAARDVVFADLLLWGWARRYLSERRFQTARALFETARRAGAAVDVEQLERLSQLLEAHDPYVHGHSRRVARHAARVARARHLPPEEIARIQTAASVHDVGKIYTAKEILRKPERLTDREFAVIKRHAADGARMLELVGDAEITAMVRHHHERIDGCGYPDGLVGEEIPLGARIIAV
ncbi:MAG TPA: HD domain-containing phosphohydrolase, partial [Solirubrobacteraceae bacterium]|nr:HD domain-containing phosphohydrolase [Solirubrobacteraceae bacterium]